jgi:hypothetical protein
MTIQSEAGSEHTYQQSIQLAATGHEAEAIAALYAVASVLSDQDIWKARMQAAAILLDMKRRQHTNLPVHVQYKDNLTLAAAYAGANQQPGAKTSWPAVVLLAVVIPGAGHAWQGRWRDAGTAAVMVWPLLILTLWAARRKMGPVTVFFALITVWLWSGTVFSAMSLVERASMETYMVWWQGLWQASALPGQPW